MTVTTTTTTTIAKNGTFVMQKWEENANHHQLLRRATESRKNTRKTNTQTKCGEKTKTQNEVLMECTPGEARETKCGSQARIDEAEGNGGQ